LLHTPLPAMPRIPPLGSLLAPQAMRRPLLTSLGTHVTPTPMPPKPTPLLVSCRLTPRAGRLLLIIRREGSLGGDECEAEGGGGVMQLLRLLLEHLGVEGFAVIEEVPEPARQFVRYRDARDQHPRTPIGLSRGHDPDMLAP
jgi:hypothetical protein